MKAVLIGGDSVMRTILDYEVYSELNKLADIYLRKDKFFVGSLDMHSTACKVIDKVKIISVKGEDVTTAGAIKVVGYTLSDSITVVAFIIKIKDVSVCLRLGYPSINLDSNFMKVKVTLKGYLISLGFDKLMSYHKGLGFSHKENYSKLVGQIKGFQRAGLLFKEDGVSPASLREQDIMDCITEILAEKFVHEFK